MKNYTLPATDFDTYALSTLLWSAPADFTYETYLEATACERLAVREAATDAVVGRYGSIDRLRQIAASL